MSINNEANQPVIESINNLLLLVHTLIPKAVVPANHVHNKHIRMYMIKALFLLTILAGSAGNYVHAAILQYV